MKFVEFNLNCTIKAKLTKLGIEKVKEKYNTFPYDEIDKKGYSSFTGWIFIKLFGEHLKMGKNLYFDTRILVEVESEESLSEKVEDLKCIIQQAKEVLGDSV